MEDKKEALMLWLQAVTNTQIEDLSAIRDGRLIEGLLTRIQGFSFNSLQSASEDWKSNYKKLNEINQQLMTFLSKNSKMALPQELSCMNLIEMSQGKSEEGLQTLLHLVFIVCIQSSIKSQVIPCIMRFPSSAQKELMMIIKESTVEKEQFDQRQSQIADFKQRIAKLEFTCNNLVVQNQNLRNCLFEDEQKVKKNQELVAKLQKENEELRRELLEKNQMLIQHRQELMLDKYGNMNEDLVDDLKKQLLERQQSYGEQIVNLNETITNLKEELGEIKKSNSKLIEQQNSRSFVQPKSADHTNCIDIEKHKIKINGMMALSKQSTQKEMAAKLQNIKLKNLNAELQSRNKRLSQQLYKKANEFTMTKDDSSKLKIQFFTRIRDSLKIKLDQFKLKNSRCESNEADFLENEN